MSEELNTLWRIFPKISRTFAFTIPKLPKEVSVDLLVAYSICRIIDTIEDSSLKIIKIGRKCPTSVQRQELERTLAYTDRFLGCQKCHHKWRGFKPVTQKSLATFLCITKKKELMSNFISALKNGKGADIIKKELEFSLHDAPEGCISLFESIEALIRVFYSLPSSIKYSIIKCAEEMAEGFLNEDIQHIVTFEDQNRYCHYAAGIVGYMITEIFGYRGYLTKEKVEKLLPLAHDFGLALQKVNIIKDVAKDMQEGRYYWPKNVLKKYGLSYTRLKKPKINVEKQSRLQVLEELKKETQKYIEKGFDYIEQLPYEPSGIRIYCADNLLMAVSTLRILSSEKLFENEIKISREMVYFIDNKVRSLTEQKLSLREFALEL